MKMYLIKRFFTFARWILEAGPDPSFNSCPYCDWTRAGKSCWGEPSSLKDGWVLVRGSTNLSKFSKRKLSCQPHWDLDSVPT